MFLHMNCTESFFHHSSGTGRLYRSHLPYQFHGPYGELNQTRLSFVNRTYLRNRIEHNRAQRGVYSVMDWNMVGALGQWAGAILTALAVVLALKQSRDATTFKLKPRADISIYYPPVPPPPGARVSTGYVLRFQVTNVGLRPVEVVSSGILLPDKSPLKIGHHLPQSLQEAESTSHWIWLKDVIAQVKAAGYYKKVNLKYYFSDATGHRHWSKFTLNVVECERDVQRLQEHLQEQAKEGTQDPLMATVGGTDRRS